MHIASSSSSEDDDEALGWCPSRRRSEAKGTEEEIEIERRRLDALREEVEEESRLMEEEKEENDLLREEIFARQGKVKGVKRVSFDLSDDSD